MNYLINRNIEKVAIRKKADVGNLLFLGAGLHGYYSKRKGESIGKGITKSMLGIGLLGSGITFYNIRKIQKQFGSIGKLGPKAIAVAFPIVALSSAAGHGIGRLFAKNPKQLENKKRIKEK